MDSTTKPAAAPPHITTYFAFEHLPPHLQLVSKPIGELARHMQETLPEGPEKTAGFRKLLEAKDCFVRSALAMPAVPAPR